MRVDGFRRVDRAARIKTALAAEERAQAPLVELDQKFQGFLHRARRQVTRSNGANEYIAVTQRRLCGFLQPALPCVSVFALATYGHDSMVLKRGLMQVLLAALLLVAQHVALTHQVWHLHDGKSAPVEQQNNGKKAAHSALCEFHVAFAEVLGAVGCDHAPLKVANNTVELSVNHSPPAFPANLVVPASRGPPVIL